MFGVEPGAEMLVRDWLGRSNKGDCEEQRRSLLPLTQIMCPCRVLRNAVVPIHQFDGRDPAYNEPGVESAAYL